MIRGKHLAGFDIERNDRTLPAIHRIIDTALEPFRSWCRREKQFGKAGSA